MQAHERVEESYKAIVQAFFGGQKAAEEMLKDAAKLRDVSQAVHKKIQEEIGKTLGSFAMVEPMARAATAGTLKKTQQEVVPAIIQKLEVHASRVKALIEQLELAASKGLRRTPQSVRDESEFRPVVAGVRKVVEDAKHSAETLAGSMDQAREQARTVATATQFAG